MTFISPARLWTSRTQRFSLRAGAIPLPLPPLPHLPPLSRSRVPLRLLLPSRLRQRSGALSLERCSWQSLGWSLSSSTERRETGALAALLPVLKTIPLSRTTVLFLATVNRRRPPRLLSRSPLTPRRNLPPRLATAHRRRPPRLFSRSPLTPRCNLPPRLATAHRRRRTQRSPGTPGDIRKGSCRRGDRTSSCACPATQFAGVMWDTRSLLCYAPGRRTMNNLE